MEAIRDADAEVAETASRGLLQVVADEMGQRLTRGETPAPEWPSLPRNLGLVSALPRQGATYTPPTLPRLAAQR